MIFSKPHPLLKYSFLFIPVILYLGILIVFTFVGIENTKSIGLVKELLLVLVFVPTLLKRSFYKTRYLRFAALYLLALFALIPLSLGNPAAAFSNFKGHIVFPLAFIIGYYHFREATLIRFIKFCVVPLFLIGLLEYSLGPETYWGNLGFEKYIDYLNNANKTLYNTSIGVFQHGNNAFSTFKNYDKVITNEGEPRVRIGISFVNPIEAGHFIVIFLIGLFFHYFRRKNVLTAILLILTMILSMLIGTKGVMFGFGMYLFIFFWIRYRRLKLLLIPLMFLCMAFLVSYLNKQISNATSIAGHLFATYSGLTSLVQNPLGFGLGSGGASRSVLGYTVSGDSYISIIGSDGGILLVFLFIIFLLSPVWEIKKIKSANLTNYAHLAACMYSLILVCILTEPIYHFVSIYLYMTYVGAIYRQSMDNIRIPASPIPNQTEMSLSASVN